MLCVLFRIASSRRYYWVHTIYHIQYIKKNTLNYPKSAAMGFYSKGLKNEFETTVVNREGENNNRPRMGWNAHAQLHTVNKPSVFEPLKVYCTRVNGFGSHDEWPHTNYTSETNTLTFLFFTCIYLIRTPNTSLNSLFYSLKMSVFLFLFTILWLKIRVF